MSRYIDADATELAVVKATTYGDALRAVREQPSIDIVRCKECKNWQTDWVPEGCEGVEDLHYCAIADGCKFGGFFCADGERSD